MLHLPVNITGYGSMHICSIKGLPANGSTSEKYLVDKEALLDLVETAYPSWMIDVRVQYVIDEVVQNYRTAEGT